MIEKVRYPLGDELGKVELIDSMGNDLSIVNDAKASFNRQATEVNEKGIKLIHYLISHQHTSPFRGVCFKFKVKAPLYCCRQWWKHVLASNHTQEQLGWNEQSFRYVTINDSGDFYIPQTFRKQAEDNKQSSWEPLDQQDNAVAQILYREQCRKSFAAYSQLIQMGVGREQARGVLVPSFYTSWVWTVSLQALLHFIYLRTGKGAQSEIALYAQAIEELIQPIVPQAMAAWKSYHQLS